MPPGATLTICAVLPENIKDKVYLSHGDLENTIFADIATDI